MGEWDDNSLCVFLGELLEFWIQFLSPNGVLKIGEMTWDPAIFHYAFPHSLIRDAFQAVSGIWKSFQFSSQARDLF